MTVLLKLFCLVDGESPSNAFPLSISSTDDVGILKELIKSKKTVDFADIDADKLTLWHVAVPLPRITMPCIGENCDKFLSTRIQTHQVPERVRYGHATFAYHDERIGVECVGIPRIARTKLVRGPLAKESRTETEFLWGKAVS
ncbi:hypothetical protein BGX26_006780, partial [Mortierella sp. AD094]